MTPASLLRFTLVVGSLLLASSPATAMWWDGFDANGLDARVRALGHYGGDPRRRRRLRERGRHARELRGDVERQYVVGARRGARRRRACDRRVRRPARRGGQVLDGRVARRRATWPRGTVPRGARSVSVVDDVVTALTVYDGELIATGFFLNAGGVPANRIARWDGSTWSTLGLGLDRPTNVLHVDGSLLYVGGDFTTAGGSPALRRGHVGRRVVGPISTAAMNGGVRAIATYDGHIAVGGFFTQGGDPPNVVNVDYVARWDGVTYHPYGTGVTVGIHASTVFDSCLVVGGPLTSAGGNAASNIACWDGTSWSNFDGGMDGLVNALTVYQGGAGCRRQLLHGRRTGRRSASPCGASRWCRWASPRLHPARRSSRCRTHSREASGSSSAPANPWLPASRYTTRRAARSATSPGAPGPAAHRSSCGTAATTMGPRHPPACTSCARRAPGHRRGMSFSRASRTVGGGGLRREGRKPRRDVRDGSR